MTGFVDEYDYWLNKCLETEDPLSGIVSDLSSFGSDVNKIISCLHNYCAAKDFDESAVCEKLRIFLKDAYHSGRLNKEEIASYMYRFAVNHADLCDLELKIWGSMFYMDDYYLLAKDRIISSERFDSAFHSYLNDGISIDFEKLWSNQEKAQKSLFRKIRAIFGKK